MKKITKQSLLRLSAFVLTLCLALSSLPVWANAQANTETGNDYASLDTATMKFQKGQQLLKTSDFTITAKDVYVAYKGYVFLELTVENTGKQTLLFSSNCCRIGGYHVSAFMYNEIRPGNKAELSLYFDSIALAAAGIQQLEQVDFSFDVSNKETYEVLYDDYNLTIPVGASIKADYHACNKVIYKEDSFSLTLLGSALPEERSAPTMVFLLENHLDGPLVVRNEGNLLMNNKECSLYISETTCADSKMVFAVTPFDNFEEIVTGGGAAIYDFYLRICTGNWNPLVDSRLNLNITKSGKIQQSSIQAVKSSGYDTGMKEYGQNQNVQKPCQEVTESKNIFMGMFDNYVPVPQYIDSLKNKYPENQARYSSIGIFPYVSELLTLYLAELEEAGFTFGIMERKDLCTESAYVVELTEDGKGVIQVAFTLKEYDPKAAHIVTLGCATENYSDLEKLNRYLDAMWYMYDTLNVSMTPQKHKNMIENSESLAKDNYVMLRGACDGLGYVYSTSTVDSYLIITPDLTLPVFNGMSADTVRQEFSEDLNVGDTFCFGSYEQDNDVANGAEDIEWVILDKEAGSVLAVSVQALDTLPFHKTAGNITWKNSSLRTWLNQDFYNTAFSKEEQKQILSQRLEPLTGKDSVFLLSRDEVEAYLPTQADRLCEATAYATTKNAYVNAATGGSWWLLRTAATQKGYVMSVNSDGTMDYDGGRVESLNGTVRPAIRISTAK